MEILYTPLGRLDTVWPHARPHIEAGLFYGRGEYEPEDILADLRQSRMQLWCVMAPYAMPGAIVTQIIPYPRKRAMRLVACGGERLREWLPLANEEITAYARRRDVDFIETYGRPGWVRALAGIGFEYGYTTAIKEL